MGDFNYFIKGALIGGAIAGVAGLLLAKKPGKLVIQDILDIYESAQQKGSDFIDELKEKGSCLTDWSNNEACDECDNHYPLLIGGALGAVIGGIATLLTVPSSRKQLSRALGKQYDEMRGQAEDFIASMEKKGNHAMSEVNDWKDTLMDLIANLTQNSNKRRHSSNMDQILNLAQIGIQLYQNLHKGK